MNSKASILAERNNLWFDIPSPKRPLHLHSSDRMHCMSTTNGVGARLRQPDILHLPLLHQLLQLPNLTKNTHKEIQQSNNKQSKQTNKLTKKTQKSLTVSSIGTDLSTRC